MKSSRNTKIKTADLIEALRRCFRGDVLLQEAASRLEKYTDRCARYAEEIAVLKAASKSNEDGLSVEKIIYMFAVRHEGQLVIDAATEDDTGRVLRICAYGNNAKRSRHVMLAHASAPTEHEVDEFCRCLKKAIGDVVTL